MLFDNFNVVLLSITNTHIIRFLIGYLLSLVHIQLLHQLLLVLFVDVLYSLYFFRSFFVAFHRSHDDPGGVREPDSFIVVLHELAPHPKYFFIVKLGNIIGHLVALLEAVFLLVCLKERHVHANGLVIIIYRFIYIDGVGRGIEHHDEGLTCSIKSINTSLDTTQVLQGLSNTLAENLMEVFVTEDLLTLYHFVQARLVLP